MGGWSLALTRVVKLATPSSALSAEEIIESRNHSTLCLFERRMSPCKYQFLQRGSEKSMSDHFDLRLIGRGGGGDKDIWHHPLDLYTKESFYCLSSSS